MGFVRAFAFAFAFAFELAFALKLALYSGRRLIVVRFSSSTTTIFGITTITITTTITIIDKASDTPITAKCAAATRRNGWYNLSLDDAIPVDAFCYGVMALALVAVQTNRKNNFGGTKETRNELRVSLERE
mmetsp:Transcript_3402/g.9523  ORF Transcript_3402/g.9523 Transcript_3402/m.9523 type:complete len:131 (-) Transcript_3402:602-994(-)